jgi:HPt (histidine-containing phosphotransfer) domain-containing protein
METRAAGCPEKFVNGLVTKLENFCILGLRLACSPGPCCERVIPGWAGTLDAARKLVMTALSPDPRILDLAHLARQTFGDRSLEREVLALFEQQCVRLLPIIAGEGEPVERADAAHTLKGAARAVGAWRLASLAETLETALDEERGDDTLGRLTAKIEAAVESTRAAVAARWRAAA